LYFKNSGKSDNDNEHLNLFNMAKLTVSCERLFQTLIPQLPKNIVPVFSVAALSTELLINGTADKAARWDG